MPVEYAFPHCTVIVDESARYIETRLPDGSHVGSTPNVDAHSMQLAAALGYGTDTWAMSRDHELAHTWLAHLDAQEYSPTMWRVAHPDGSGWIADDEVAEEEQRVLDYQRNLVKHERRPWDLASVPRRRSRDW